MGLPSPFLAFELTFPNPAPLAALGEVSIAAEAAAFGLRKPFKNPASRGHPEIHGRGALTVVPPLSRRDEYGPFEHLVRRSRA